MIRHAPLLLALFLGACASHGGRGLVIGESDAAAVFATMGTPSLQWQENDGSRQLAYPRGPMGVHTFMVHLDARGILARIENVLTPEQFARVKPGMSMEEVLRLLGPVDPTRGVAYFSRRDELAWEWRYCDDWHRLSRFNVLFDGTTGTVRSTLSLIDFDCERFGRGACWCSR